MCHQEPEGCNPTGKKNVIHNTHTLSHETLVWCLGVKKSEEKIDSVIGDKLNFPG